jgi:hypothetical protein
MNKNHLYAALYGGSDRYQSQRWLIRVGRWLRWKPLFALWSLWVILLWYIGGAHIPDEERIWLGTRREYTRHLWTLGCSLADCKMKNYVTCDELLDDSGPNG